MGNQTLFRRACGDRWKALHPAVRALHEGGADQSYRGMASVKRGTSVVAQLVCAVFRFPPATEETPVSVRKVRRSLSENWTRHFGHAAFSSTCLASPKEYHVRERFGLLTCEQELVPCNGGIKLVLHRGWCLGVPLPAALLPQVQATEGVAKGRFTFDIGLSAPAWLPRNHQILVRYRGWLEPV